jgi:hypothetical protein
MLLMLAVAVAVVMIEEEEIEEEVEGGVAAHLIKRSLTMGQYLLHPITSLANVTSLVRFVRNVTG